MIRQIAVAVLAAGALAACVPGGYGDAMTPYSSGYANPLTQAITQMASSGYGYGQPSYGFNQPSYGYNQTPYANPYYGAAAPVYTPPPPQVVYMPQQTPPTYGAPPAYGYGAGRAMWQGRHHHQAAADRNGNGVADWKERDRNNDGVPDYQQRSRRFSR